MEQNVSVAVALGMFDGMHAGHRALIAHTVAFAKQTGCLAAVYTFTNHPATVLGGGSALLSDAAERAALMRALGCDIVRMDAFTRELAALPPEAFIDMLCESWNVRRFVVGFNYTFGRYGAGTPELLREAGARMGFSVDVVEPVLYGGEPVSSSRIRRAIEAGDVSAAADMLSRPYTLTGEVVANRRIGRRIGFPTANIAAAPDRVLPMRGVYATDAIVNGTVCRAVTNVGSNPTVGGDHLSIETHMIGFDGDIYGETLSVRFLRRLRGETKFDSVTALGEQIARDVRAAEALAPNAEISL